MHSLGRWLGWLGLALCMLRLKADLITHLNPPKPELSSHPCVFPFTYGDVTHYSCTSVHSDFHWCSLDSQFQGRWRYCTSSDPPQCSFPFFFKSKVFHMCTKEDYILDRSWCSLTKNYNKDKKWKQCSPHNI
ncbi:binder of sperm protein homolog 2-like isoform X2 [Ochotona princeps]|uniref:binder of sperm protein homolog 2-like isoform X2 n=1 Tax=Ochotona princeps TaxID=9978 RepID=UPI0027154675|nr:binder of sperm protein homolog 2-like isoform X2 [Ochotona princeps]